MAISTSAAEFRNNFNPHSWASFEEYETFKIQYLCEKGNFVYHTYENGKEVKFDAVNHHPELKEYEIWMEGYAATGERGYANKCATIRARNFAQAVHIYECINYLKRAEKINDPTYKEYVDAGRWDYEPNRLSNWACKYYWSEELARKSFG